MYSGAVRKVSRQDLKVVKVSMEVEDKDNLYKECVYAGGGPSQYISWLKGDKRPLHDVLGFRKEINGITMDIALQWYVDGYSDTMLGFANGLHTLDGGTHIDGVKDSITRTINSLAKKLKLVKEEDIILCGEHVREGLTCIVSVFVPNPEFEGQKQRRLGNPYVREIVDKSVQEYLTEYFELHPDVLESIVSKSFSAFKNALTVKTAREVIRSESVSTSLTIHEKPTNRSSGKIEIVIGIGQSSGGAAQHGHDRRLQNKRTRQQPRSNGAVSTAPLGRSFSDSCIDKKRQKVVASSLPSRRDGVVSTAPGKPLENVSVKTLKGVSPGAKRPNRKNVSGKTLKGISPGSNKTKPVIPIGPGFQAEIPVWIAPTKKGKFYGSPGDSDTLKWLGTGVWPTYSLKKKVHKKKIGEGRPDSCSCATPGTTTCIKLHIKETRELLEKEIGGAFYAWKFDEMGEVGSKSWTAKEEKKFESLVKNNPLSSCDGFWKFASKSFPKRSEKDLISYYYNVFLNHRNSDDDHYGDFLAG